MRIQLSVLLVSMLFSCDKDTPNLPAAIDYPAAYVVNADNTISVINLEKLSVDTTFFLPNNGNVFAHHIAKSSDNTTLVVAMPAYDFSNGHAGLHGQTFKGGVMTINAKTGQPTGSTTLDFTNHNAVFSKDGKEIWTALFTHSGAKMVVLSAENLTKIAEIPVGTDASEVVFSSDGKTAFVVGQEGSFVYAVDAANKTLAKQVKVDFFPSNVWPGPENWVFVENDNAPSINIIDTEKLVGIDAIDLDFAPGFIAYDSANDMIWTTDAAKGQVVLFEKQNGAWQEKKRIATDVDAHAIAFVGNQAFVVNQKGNSVSVIDLKTLEKTKDITVGLKPNGIVIIE